MIPHTPCISSSLTPCLILIAALWAHSPAPAAADVEYNDYEETDIIGAFRGELQGCAMTPIPGEPFDLPQEAMIPIYKARAGVGIPNTFQVENLKSLHHDDFDLWILNFEVGTTDSKACEMTAFILKYGDHMYGQELSSACGDQRNAIYESVTVTSQDLIPGGAPELAFAITTRAVQLGCQSDIKAACESTRSSAYALSIEGGTPRWVAFGAPLQAIFPSPLNPLTLTECPTGSAGFKVQGDSKALAADALKAFSEGRYADAIGASQRATASQYSDNSDNSAHSFLIARAAHKLGDCASARAFYTDFIGVLPDDPRAKLAQQFLDDLDTCHPTSSATTPPPPSPAPSTPAACDPKLTPDLTNPEDAAIKSAQAFCDTQPEDSDSVCYVAPIPSDGEGDPSDPDSGPRRFPHLSLLKQSYNAANSWSGQSLAVEANGQLWLLRLTSSGSGPQINDPESESIDATTIEDVIPGGQPELVFRLTRGVSRYGEDADSDRNSVPDTVEDSERVLIISLDGERPRVVFSATTAKTITDNTHPKRGPKTSSQSASVSWKDGVVSVRAVAGSPPSAKVGDYTLSANGCIAP
jgi:hypothetical protein